MAVVTREGEREKGEIEAQARQRAEAILSEARARAGEIAVSWPPAPSLSGGDTRWAERNAAFSKSFETALEKIRSAALGILSGLPRPERVRLLLSFWEEVHRDLPEGQYLVKGPPEAAGLAVSSGGFVFSFEEVREERVTILSGDGTRVLVWSLESVVESYFRSRRGKLASVILEGGVA
ncbi:hypothetical protein EPN96_02565 [bacterium]|nr:MAG: hypothetical protein EPN96_02565 [bacterium]